MTTDVIPTIQIHHVAVDDSRHDLQESVRSKRGDMLTLPNGLIATISDHLYVIKIPISISGVTLQGLVTCIRCCRAEESRSCALGQRNHSQVTTYHIRQPLERSTTGPDGLVNTDMKHIHLPYPLVYFLVFHPPFIRTNTYSL